MIELKDFIKNGKPLNKTCSNFRLKCWKGKQAERNEKISEDNDKLRRDNEKLNKDNNIFKEQLTSIENKSMHIQRYQCDNCNIKSEGMTKMEKHMIDNHSEIEKE